MRIPQRSRVEMMMDILNSVRLPTNRTRLCLICNLNASRAKDLVKILERFGLVEKYKGPVSPYDISYPIVVTKKGLRILSDYEELLSFFVSSRSVRRVLYSDELYSVAYNKEDTPEEIIQRTK